MPLHSFLQRKPSSDETRKRIAAASAEEDDTADPEGDLASGRFTRHASSEEFLTSLLSKQEHGKTYVPD